MLEALRHPVETAKNGLKIATVAALMAAPGGARAESSVHEAFRADGALPYPALVEPDPSRMPVFPDVEVTVDGVTTPPLAAYETPYEDGDYFEDGHGDVDLPQFNYRVITAGEIEIPQLGIDLEGDDNTGSAAILINHFGETAMFRDATVDNGFTIAGRVWNMSEPEQVTQVGQALLDHYMGRMTESEDGANCGTIDACDDVNFAVAVVGNGEAQVVWEGTYDPNDTANTEEVSDAAVAFPTAARQPMVA